MDGGKSNANPAAAKGEEGKERKEVEVAAPEEEAEDRKEQSVGEENGDGEGGGEEEFDRMPEFPPPRRISRTPFTSLSQIDADLVLARTLQEQERAYVMLSWSGGQDVGGGSGGDLLDYESGSEYDEMFHDDQVHEDDESEEGSAVVESEDDEDAVDDEDPTAGIDSSAFEDDESYARALQEAEERELADRFMAWDGINDWVAEDVGDYGTDAQEMWSEVDPGELSYEELIALGEAVGTESRGLTNDIISSLPSVSYKAQNTQEGSSDQCVICQLDYVDGGSLIVLSCKHMYHPECINKWLQINKVCPICNAEVSSSEGR